MYNKIKYIVPMLLTAATTTYGNSSCARELSCYEPCPVVATRPSQRFELYFSALALKPSASNMHYAAEAVTLPVQSPHWNIFDIHPKYHFGFDLGGRVIIDDTGANLMFNWVHLRSSRSASQTVPAADMVGPFFNIGPDGAPYNITEGNVKFHFDAAHIDFGQIIDFGDRLSANLFAGLGFARIKQNLTSAYSNADATTTRTIETPLRFTGAGPECGVDFSYRIFNEFRLTGKARAALLTGKLKNHTTFTSTSPVLTAGGFPTPNIQNTNVENRTQIVPAFEESIGLAYGFSSFCEKYWITLEAGYQSKIYLNALQSVDMGSEVAGVRVIAASAGVFARTFQRTLSNFAVGGPYITLSVEF